MLGYAMGFLALGIGASTGSKSLAMAIPSAIARIWIRGQSACAPSRFSLVHSIHLGHALLHRGQAIYQRASLLGTPWVLISIAVISLAVGLYRFNNRDLA